MHSLERKVKDFIRKHDLIPKNTHVLVGVSGGPDSLALLHFLKSIKDEYQLTITVAHVDHMFRGAESYAELEYVQSICKEWGFRFEGKHINVPEEIAKRKESSQAVSRAIRYEFFQEVMEKYQIPYLALAHHGDDQIETVIMRLIRGSSLRATAGIKAKRQFGDGYIIRPFLAITRAEIEEYILAHSLEPVIDPSNEKDLYTRNRIRKYVLPFLKKENQNVHEHFQQFSEELIEDDQYLMELAKASYSNIVHKTKSGLHLKINKFLQAPLPLQRRYIHLILNYLYKGDLPSNLSRVNSQLIIDLLNQPNPSSQLHLPKGIKAIKSYDVCLFTYKLEESEGYLHYINEGETVTLPNGDQLILSRGSFNGFPSKSEFILDKNINLPLLVRSRKNGDRISLKGTGGTKKLKSVFIDEKVPIQKRNEWPIVVDTSGNILWIPELKKSKFEADNTIDEVFILQYIKYEDTQEDL